MTWGPRRGCFLMKPKTKKTFTPILLSALLFSLLPVGWFPTVAAATPDFTNFATITTTSATTQPHTIKVLPLNSDIFLVAFVDRGNSDLYAYRCSLSGSTCVSRTIVVGTIGLEFSLQRISDTVAYACALFGAIPDSLRVYKTTDAGGTWSTGTGIYAADDAVGCAVDEADGLTVAAYTTDGTIGSATVEWTTSTDGGSTFGAITTVSTPSTDNPQFDFGIAMETSLKWDLFGNLATTDTVFRCATTTGGVSMSCADQSISSFGHLKLQKFSGTSYLFGTEPSGNTQPTMIKTEDAGSTLTSSVCGTTTNLDDTQFSRESSSLIHCAFARSTATTEPCFYSQTTDNGITWETPYAPFTLGVAPSSTSHAVGVGSLSGTVILACGYDPDAGTNAQVRVLASAELVGDFASVAVTDLTGFDIDPSGSYVMARTNGGDFARTYSGGTLTLAGSEDTDCVGDDGVFVQAALVAFHNCKADIDNPPNLSIRTLTMGNPTPSDFQGCGSGGGSFTCPRDISLSFTSGSEEFSEAGQQLNDLGEIAEFPIDYRVNDENIVGLDRRKVAWAFRAIGTDPDVIGRIGVNSFTNVQGDVGGEDGRRTSQVQYSTTQAEDFCAATRNLESDPSSYIVAVDSASNTKRFDVDFGTATRLTSTLTDAATFSTTFGNAIAVACHESRVILAKSSTVYGLDYTGAFLWSVAASGVAEGVAISGVVGGLQWGAYVDGSQWVVVDMLDGSEECRGSLPDGAFEEMKITNAGGRLFVGSEDYINGFQLAEFCGDVPSVPETPPEVTPTPGAGDGLFDGAGARVGTAIGGGTFGGNLFLGTILIGMTSTGVGTYTRRGWGWAMGAIVGFLLAWAFGFFNTAVVFTCVVLVGAIWYFVLRGGND